MTDKQFLALFSDAIGINDRDAYVSDWALSSIWGDADDADIPPQRIEDLGAIWDVAHLSIRDIRRRTGLSQVGFATRYCIPRRTVESWEAGDRSCPDYLRLLLAQDVGLYARP